MPFCYWLIEGKWQGQLSNWCILCLLQWNQYVSLHLLWPGVIFVNYVSEEHFVVTSIWKLFSKINILFSLKLAFSKIFSTFLSPKKVREIHLKIYSPVTRLHLYYGRIILFLRQWLSRGYTQDKFILMYARLFIHGNIGGRAKSGCGCAHARKSAGSKRGTWQKVSCPDSVFSRKSEWRRRPWIPWTGSANREARGCALLARAAGCTIPCTVPAITLHNVSISQNRFCTELNSISVELQLFKIYLWCYAKGHLHYRSSPFMWPSAVKNSCTDFVTRQTENHTV